MLRFARDSIWSFWNETCDRHERTTVVGTRSSRGSQLPPHVVSHRAHVGPAEAAAAQQHVPDQGLYGRLAHQTYKEKLLYHLGTHSSEGG